MLSQLKAGNTTFLFACTVLSRINVQFLCGTVFEMLKIVHWAPEPPLSILKDQETPRLRAISLGRVCHGFLDETWTLPNSSECLTPMSSQSGLKKANSKLVSFWVTRRKQERVKGEKLGTYFHGSFLAESSQAGCIPCLKGTASVRQPSLYRSLFPGSNNCSLP